jgi:hypothetical protein
VAKGRKEENQHSGKGTKDRSTRVEMDSIRKGTKQSPSIPFRVSRRTNEFHGSDTEKRVEPVLSGERYPRVYL